VGWPLPTIAGVHSPLAFLAVAAAVTLTPGPAFALLLQTAAAHGRRVALANIAGNSVGVLIWGCLSALGVSALIAANHLAYDALRITGAGFLLYLGLRALLSRGSPSALSVSTSDNNHNQSRRAARKGLVNCLANPKLAVFFVALFPQFLTPGTAVLPAALGMAGVIVLFDVLVYGTVAIVVDRFRQVIRPHAMRRLSQASGAVLVLFGLRLAREAR
jgi:threonine/homoserine/homoserine lactone efflux protein